jgi:hypothetical protein
MGAMMTAKEPMWGTGTSTPDSYALRDSDVVLRLLLPAQVTGVADRVPWRTVARAFGDVTRVDGYTSWVELTELYGQGGTVPPQAYRPPAGYVDTDTYRLLLEASLRALGDTTWIAAGAPGWSTSGAPLTACQRSTPLTSTNAEWGCTVLDGSLRRVILAGESAHPFLPLDGGTNLLPPPADRTPSVR